MKRKILPEILQISPFKSIDKPDRPEAIAVKEFKKDSVIIEWKPPVDDGGLEITKYSIEKCDPEKNVWIKVVEVEKHIASFCVQKLMANAQYVFRIMALNSIGVSEPIESEPITIKVKVGKLFEKCSCYEMCSFKTIPNGFQSPFHLIP